MSLGRAAAPASSTAVITVMQDRAEAGTAEQRADQQAQAEHRQRADQTDLQACAQRMAVPAEPGAEAARDQREQEDRCRRFRAGRASAGAQPAYAAGRGAARRLGRRLLRAPQIAGRHRARRAVLDDRVPPPRGAAGRGRSLRLGRRLGHRVRRRRIQRARRRARRSGAAATTRPRRRPRARACAAKASIPPLPSIDRNSPQPISASSTAVSDAPSTRPDSSLRASFSSSPSKGISSQAKP